MSTANLEHDNGDSPSPVNRRLGIITGSGPEAGIDLFSKVLSVQRQALGDRYRGDIDSPNVTMLSVPELGHSMDLPRTEQQVWDDLRQACERIAPQVDAFAIACNTLYYYEDAIRALDLPALLISPVDCIRRESQRRDGRSMALLGAAPVTDLSGDTSPYACLHGEVELELYPDPQRTHRLIEQIKITGGSSPELEVEFQAIVEELSSEAALLACTELPLLRGEHVAAELVDVTMLLADAMVTRQL